MRELPPPKGSTLCTTEAGAAVAGAAGGGVRSGETPVELPAPAKKVEILEVPTAAFFFASSLVADAGAAAPPPGAAAGVAAAAASRSAFASFAAALHSSSPMYSCENDGRAFSIFLTSFPFFSFIDENVSPRFAVSLAVVACQSGELFW